MQRNRPFIGSNAFRTFAIGAFILAVIAVFVVVPGGDGDKDVIHVTMWSSGEKMNYLRDIVEEYNREKHVAPGTNKRIEVNAYTVNSGPQSDYLIAKLKDGADFPQGVTEPQIISPSVDHWLTRVNLLSNVEVFDIKNTKPLALTPVVIATYEEMARALGWPQKEIGWSDIIALANDPEGWAAYPGSKVEWGRQPLLGWTDPTISSTARTALFATYASAAGKPASELTIADVRRPEVQAFVSELQSAVDHYFPETLKLQTKIFQGPKFIHFAPLEEYNLVWLKQGKVNAESVPGAKPEMKPLDRKMVAIYPKEGTIWHNNPGGVLQNVPWTTPEQQTAAAAFIDYLLEPEQQAKAQEWGFRPANPSMSGGPYLNAEYGIDPTQPKKLLGEVDPAVAEEILANWEDVKKPGVVVLVLDTSGSMQGDKIVQAKRGALGFLDTISPANHVGLLTFSSRVDRQLPIQPITRNRFVLASNIENTSASGGTALYDAIKAAVTMADTYDPSLEAIRGVIVLSDGANTEGVTKLSDLFELRTGNEQRLTNYNNKPTPDIHASALGFTTTHPVHVFSIGYGKDADLEVLRIFSEGTNSTFSAATEQNITEILELFGKYF